jgi:hypothetical protein
MRRGGVAGGVVLAAVVLVAGTIAGGSADAADQVPWYQRPITVGSGFTLGNGPTVGLAATSASGRWVAFISKASNLVPNDSNNANDLFLRDRWTDTTIRIAEHAGPSDPVMSPDGRWIANRLLNRTTNTTTDVVYDRVNHTLRTTPMEIIAINNGGWFATTMIDPVNVYEDGGPITVPAMAKLEPNGTTTGPYQSPTGTDWSAYTPALRHNAGVTFDRVGAILRPSRIDLLDGSVLDASEQLKLGPTPAVDTTVTGSSQAISADGRYLVYSTGPNGGTFLRWDSATGTAVSVPKLRFDAHLQQYHQESVLNDGRIVYQTSDFRVAIADPSNPTEVYLTLRDVSRGFSDHIRGWLAGCVW